MKQMKGSINPADLGIDDTPYEPARRGTESKYDATFAALKPGQRLKCPPDTANRLSAQYKKWLISHGNPSAEVRARNRCEDGFGGVWWIKAGEKPRTVWAGLKKAA